MGSSTGRSGVEAHLGQEAGRIPRKPAVALHAGENDAVFGAADADKTGVMLVGNATVLDRVVVGQPSLLEADTKLLALWRYISI